MYKKLYKVVSRNLHTDYYACDSLTELETELNYEYYTIEYLGEILVIDKTE